MRTKLLVGIVTSGVLASACTGSPTPNADATATNPLLTFRSGGVSFRYPSMWTAHRYVAVSSFSSSIVYLSNDRLHPPCRTTRRHGSISTVCGSPIAHLRPGGVLVIWTEHGFPNWNFNTRAQGRLITVGGHRAKIQIPSSLSPCTYGFDQSVTVIIDRPPDNWWEVDACIRGPGVAATLRQVRAMLQSAHLPAQ